MTGVQTCALPISFKLTKPGLFGDSLRSPVQAFTAGLMALATLVLLIACANLASTLAARGADRAREIAIRISIGASRARIIQQLLAETLLLSSAAGAAGYLSAYAASAALSTWQLPIDLPTRFDIHPDTFVFLLTFASSIAAGLIFGLAPARQASTLDANAALKNVDGASGVRHRWPLRDVLVAVQVALCFVLVAACLLSLRGQAGRHLTGRPIFDHLPRTGQRRRGGQHHPQHRGQRREIIVGGPFGEAAQRSGNGRNVDQPG